MHPPGGAYGPYAVVVIHLRASLVILLGVNSNFKIFVETLKVLLHKSFHYGIILQNCGGRLRTMPKRVGCVWLLFYFLENIHIGFDCVYIF